MVSMMTSRIHASELECIIGIANYEGFCFISTVIILTIKDFNCLIGDPVEKCEILVLVSASPVCSNVTGEPAFAIRCDSFLKFPAADSSHKTF